MQHEYAMVMAMQSRFCIKLNLYTLVSQNEIQATKQHKILAASKIRIKQIQ